MSSQESYLTVAKQASGELVEKKSRFIGHIAPVANETQAQNFVAQIKADFKDATHNVFAFVLRENNLARFSDDGEPQGTAGKPILAMLQKENLVDVAVVVTRYFGGTLLGTGGLVRAYSHAAKLALTTSGIIEMTRCNNLRITMAYNLYDIFMTKLPKYTLRITDTIYTDNVTVELTIKTDQKEDFVQELAQMSNATAKILEKNQIFSYFERE